MLLKSATTSFTLKNTNSHCYRFFPSVHDSDPKMLWPSLSPVIIIIMAEVEAR